MARRSSILLIGSSPGRAYGGPRTFPEGAPPHSDGVRAGGAVLRYGGFYGPGAWDEQIQLVRKRLQAGEMAVGMMTEGRGFSNAKAKRDFGWELRYPSWRQGFKAELSVGPLGGRLGTCQRGEAGSPAPGLSLGC